MSGVTSTTAVSLRELAATEQATTFKLGHRPELDGVRGISILLVLLLHFNFKTFRGGFLGVDIFFVLSGFLITSLLIEEFQTTRTINLKRFYIRRALRLMPALVMFITLTGLYALLFLHGKPAWSVYQGMLLTMSYVSNWVFALMPTVKVGPLGITWSLAIEEQFYLLWPPIVALALRLKMQRRTLVLIVTLAIAAIALHRKMLLEGDATIARMYYATDTRADALLVGCLLSLMLAWNLLPRTDLFRWCVQALALVAAIFLAVMVVKTPQANVRLYEGAFTLVSLAIGCLILLLVLYPPAVVTAVLNLAVLRWVGRVSYGLYLWHWPVREFVCPDIEKASVMRLLLVAVLAFGITSLSYYLIERPFLRMKKRFTTS